VVEWSGGRKVDGLGRRGFGGSGCCVAIISHIHDFLTVRGGVTEFLLIGCWPSG